MWQDRVTPTRALSLPSEAWKMDGSHVDPSGVMLKGRDKQVATVLLGPNE